MSLATHPRDDRLAAILADLAEQQKRGAEPNIDSVAQEHPDLADELRSLWATAQFAAAFAPQTPTIAHDRPALEQKPPPDSLGDYEILDG